MLALPFLFSLPVAAKPRPDRLDMEIVGMIADRQMEERRKAVESQPQTQADKVNPRQEQDQPEPERKAYSQAPSVPTLASQAAAAGAAVEQRRQTINTASDPANALRQYIARASRRIQGNLVYPPEVMVNRIEGTVVISFSITTDGNIAGNSLRVKRSSGYASLDASALKATRDSAPFGPPPREFEVTIGVTFDLDRL